MSDSPPKLRFRNPPNLATPVGYSHVAEVVGGRTIYVSGQVPLDPAGRLVGAGDLRQQAEQVFQNLRTALGSVGVEFRSVVRLTYYLRDIGQLPVVREVRDRFVDRQNPPTSTAVGVTGLARPEFLLEVDAVAVVPH